MARFASRLGRIERALGRLPPANPARRLAPEAAERALEIMRRHVMNSPEHDGFVRSDGVVWRQENPVPAEEVAFAGELMRPLMPAFARAWRWEERERVKRRRRSAVFSGADSLGGEDDAVRVAPYLAMNFWRLYEMFPPQATTGATISPPGG